MLAAARRPLPALVRLSGALGLCALAGAAAAQATGPQRHAAPASPPGAMAATPAPAAAAATPPASAASFARVGDTEISAVDYQRALAVAMRKKYYHAKPPEAELARFQREVGDDVVNRVLLLAEARRRGIQPDAARIQATVAGYDAQYGSSPTWKTSRERMLANVLPQLERDSLLERLETLVRRVDPATEAQAQAFYDDNRQLFVEPEQVKLAVILLKVDPSSPQAVWTSALAEGRTLHRKLLAGASFNELARLHSGDRSAARGGEMEYTHRGMLPEAVHAVVDKLQPGQTSEPVQLLEGVAILRLDGRQPARQRGFEQVKERARELWQRQEAERRWKQLIAQLRQGTPIRVDERHYAPLPAPVESRARAG